MKKGIIAIVVIIIAIILIIVLRSPSTPNNPATNPASSTPVVVGEQTPSAPVSETVKVSSQLSEYHNAELGFSVKYPTAWEKADTDMGVSFIMPIDKDQVSTLAKLQADINIVSGTCTFPPVTTIKDRGTLKVGSETLKTITMSNTVQGRGYFDHMYSLQKDSICYMFKFSSITFDPASKGLKGSNITQAQNNNKAIVTSSDTAFTDMIKTFKFIAPEKGIDETKAPVKK